MKKTLIAWLVLIIPILAYAAGSYVLQGGTWYNTTTGQAYYVQNLATYPPGVNTFTPTVTSTPSIFPTLVQTPTPGISFLGIDGKGNIKTLTQATGSNAPASISLGSATTFTEYAASVDNNSGILHNPYGWWLDRDGHVVYYLGYDSNDGRWNNPGVLFLNFQASNALETLPYFYEFESNNGDLYYKDFAAIGITPGSAPTSMFWDTYYLMQLFGGVNSGGATIGAGVIAYQPAPVATMTPAVSTPVIISAKPYTQMSLAGIAATPVTNIYWGGVLQSVNATPVQ